MDEEPVSPWSGGRSLDRDGPRPTGDHHREQIVGPIGERREPVGVGEAAGLPPVLVRQRAQRSGLPASR